MQIKATPSKSQKKNFLTSITKMKLTNNLTWKNKSLPIHTSFLVEVIDGLLSSWEELHREGK